MIFFSRYNALSYLESGNGLHSRSGLKVRSSPLLLGASDLALFPLYQLVDFRLTLMVSETSASETGSLEERLRSGKPSSRFGRSRTLVSSGQDEKAKVFDSQVD